MWNIRTRNLSGLFLPLLFACVCTSCVADKRTVDPYRDRSYTRSVAQVNKSQPREATVSQESNQKSSEKKIVTRPRSQQKPLPSNDISSDAMLPLLTLINDRIVAYESKVEQWDNFLVKASTINFDEEQQENLTSCYNQLKNILSAYDELHLQLISETNGNAPDASAIEGFLAVDTMDIGYLESGCQQIVLADQQADTWVAGTKDRLLEEKEREIGEKMISGEYLQVIELFGQLPLEEGQTASYDTVYNYGQALLRSGRENDAAEVFQDLLVNLREKDTIEREFKLMQLVADIQFGMENFDKAFERYIHIINRYAGLGENIDWARKQQSMISARNSQGIEVMNYAELIRSYITYNADRDAFRVSLLAKRFMEDFPGSSVIPTVNYILFESKDRAEAWFALVMQRISNLTGEKKYQEALQLIEQLPMHEIPMDKREELNMLTDELISESFEEQESKRLAIEEAMQDIWHNGQNHLRAKEYDQAIEVFSTLLDTAYAERANDKIAEASQLAAQEDRREAAELFVRASNSSDRDNKIALLLESRQLLKGILTKYPQSGLVEKAQRNLERIEDEIRSIDPALLTELEVTEDEQENTIEQDPATTVNGIPLGEWKEQVPTGLPQE